MREYEIKKIESIEAFEKLKGRWNELLSESRTRSIFLTWEWLYTWAECYLDRNKELFIISLYKKGNLIGIAPWYINHLRFGPFKIRCIEFLGTPETGSDYLDVLMTKDLEREISSQLYDYLINVVPERWDCLYFKDIPSNSVLLKDFIVQFQRERKHVEVRQASLCPVVKLPETWEEYFGSLSANRRQQFRRHSKKLNDKGAIEHRVLVDKDTIQVFEDFYRLYEKRWGNKSKFSLFLRKFIDRSAGNNWVQLDLLNVDGTNIAGIFHLRYHEVRYYYLMAVDRGFDDKISIGNILMGLCIRKTIEDGCYVYDLLKGSERFKFHWSNDENRLFSVLFYSKKPGPMLLYLFESMKRLGKIILR